MLMLKKFFHNRRGAVFTIIALCFVSMAGIVATAMDMARGNLLKSELISALDAAALAGGTVANSNNMNAVVQKYFDVNLPAGYLTATIDPIDIHLADDKTTLTVSASAHLKNSMMQIVGWNMTNVAATSEVTIERKGMELVLVLDNTGSMSDPAGGGISKLTALKNAATDLVNILYGNNTTTTTFWIGLVPFSQAVNIGSTRASWTSGSSSYNPTTWAGCVEAREASNRDVTDDPPATALFPKYYDACFPMTGSWQTWWNAWYGKNTGSSPPAYTNCNTGSGWQYRSGIANDTYGPNQYCPQALTPMSSTKATIISGINSMQAIGDTQINTGLVWGWRMLSPRWQTLWGGQMNTDGLPKAYNTPLMNKVVILLSDGNNSFVGNNYTAYGKLADGRLGTTNSSTAVTTLNTRTDTVCDAMKASDKNILIYTVALGTAITSSGKTLLEGCASKPEYYFESPTGTDLQEAFHVIGDSLSNLRISR